MTTAVLKYILVQNYEKMMLWEFESFFHADAAITGAAGSADGGRLGAGEETMWLALAISTSTSRGPLLLFSLFSLSN